MFAKSIVFSDSFLDMPLSTRCLYFYLGMVADDDGFIDNSKSILRQIGASQDDLNLLLENHLIISFESGILVITHWKIHNYIPKDRYRETKYISEKSKLKVEKTGLYTFCIQPVYRVYTQDRLGKDRLGKDRLSEDRLGEDRLGKDRLGEDRLGEDRLGEDKLNQDKLNEARRGEDRRGEVRQGEDRRGEVR